MQLFIDAELTKTMPLPQFYFTWGDEAAGMVSTGMYDANDVYHYTGRISRESAKEMSLPFNNPYN